jgi:diadenosine tetraphosphate (Ap4A) HIT family hydrolase
MDDPYAFELDPQLQADTVLISDWHLCQVRLMNDSRYPWVILIPKVPGVAEIHELANEQQHLLLEESVRLSKALEQLFSPHKLNVAALGNVVRQLHVHHIVRFENDETFPKPVWGIGDAIPLRYGCTARYRKWTSDRLGHSLSEVFLVRYRITGGHICPVQGKALTSSSPSFLQFAKIYAARASFSTRKIWRQLLFCLRR